MESAELDRLAWDGAELPRGLPYSETLYFLMVRGLYTVSRMTEMSAEQGRREKVRIVDAVRAFQADERLVRHTAQLRLETGAALAEYTKARAALEEQKTTMYLPPAVVNVIAAGDKIVQAFDGIQVEESP